MDKIEFISYYNNMIKVSLEAILNRFEASSSNFIDTKIDIITGKNFDDDPSPENQFKSSKYIYSWIQGRGLEALAGHLSWLKHSNLPIETQESLAQRIYHTLRVVMDSCETLRSKLNGRMWFVVAQTGEAMQIVDFYKPTPLTTIPAGANYSELFYFKGLYAAAHACQDVEKKAQATAGFAAVLDDILAEKFRTDQQAFDSNNPVTFDPNKRLQGPKMIALGGLALLMNTQDTSFDWADYTAKFITTILDHHVNLDNRLPEVAPFGFIEALTLDNQPFLQNGAIVGDPGHATEFVGLASKCLLQEPFCQRFSSLAERMKQRLPHILKENFKLGFNPIAGGICKSVNLATAEKINSDMPWWNLPETMRAVGYMLPFMPELDTILQQCDQAFRNGFVNPNVYMMAYQNRNAQGEVINIVPATPDADPGYHTNLSIIDLIATMG